MAWHTIMLITTLWLCALVALGVCIVMIHSIATFQRGGVENAAVAGRRHIGEILWAIVPIAIIAAMAVPAVKNSMAPPLVTTAQSHTTLSINVAAGYNADRK
jgi:heme/copper-type cytochrome/quinol oxidase subunit 2